MNGARLILLRVINIIGFVIGILLGLRIILKFFGANPVTPFVSWVYSVSDGLVSPFRGIFSDFAFQGNSILDISAIVALIAYMILISLLTALLNSLLHPVSHPHEHAGV